MARKKDYSSWEKDDLIKRIEALEKRKKYGLVWDEESTREEFEEESRGKLPVLVEVKEKAIDAGGGGPTHIMIEGDNYHALSVLNYTHEGKVDVIYIDPPYNTGNNDFIFNDSYVNKDDAYRHSKWLSFVYKRISKSKELIKDDGLLFISIDDNEHSRLKILCDEKFGEKNFIANIVVLSNPRGKQQMKIAIGHEYLLVYARNIDSVNINNKKLPEEIIEQYNKTDEQGNRYRDIGLRKRGAAARRVDVPNLYYPIYINPKNGRVSLEKSTFYEIEVLPYLSNGEEGRWRWGKKKFSANFDRLYGRIVSSRKHERWDVFERDYLVIDGKEKKIKIKGIWDEKEINYEKAKKLLKLMFDGESKFDFPKTNFLLKKLLDMRENKKSIVLDYFAGSGTTGHAVLELNKEDGGKRQFIVCTNNENGIAVEVCYPRLKKVMEGYRNARGQDVEGLGGKLRYFKTDFVPDENTDANKKLITERATAMLCLREGTFDEVEKKANWEIYRSGEKHTAILYEPEEIEPFSKRIEETEGAVSIYVFSLGNDTYAEAFAGLEGRATLCAVPESILKVYRRIHR